MTFRQFAFNNVRRNVRSYGAYFLSSAFAVMIFFVYAMFIFHPQMEKPEYRLFILRGVELAEYIIFFFSFLFVLYSVSAFLKARQKEFGILMIQGMSRGQLNRLVFFENMIIGLLATGFGILAGLLFVKLFFLIWEQVLDMKGWSMYVPYQSVGLTVAAFFGLFLVISFLTAFLIRSNRVIELLRGSRKPKGEPKSSIGLCLLGTGCLGTAYGMAFAATKDWPVEVLFTIVGLAVVGIYFLFSQLSVFLIRWLKSRRRFYWRGVHLLWLSDLAHRMRDNARMLFLVTIILTSAFTATGVVLAYNQELEDYLPSYAFSYYAEPGVKPEKEHLGMLERELEQEKLDYQKMQAFFSYYIVAGKKKDKGVILNTLDVTRYNPSDSAYEGEEMVMIPLSDYNRFAKEADMETLKLKQGETLYLPPLFPRGETSKWLSGNEESFYFKESGLSVKVMAKEEHSPFIHDMESAALVVSDADAQKLDPSGSKGRFTAYLIPDWRDTMSFGVKLVEDFTEGSSRWEESPASQFFDSHGYTSRLITSRAFDYATVQLGPRTGLFVGIFIAVIFVISAGSFLYFRLHTDLNQDRKQYRTLAKVGLSEKEMRKAATVQVALLFFAPFAVAVVNACVALNTARVIFSSMLEPTLITIGAFFLVQLCYFFLVRSRYLHHLKKAMF